MRLSRAESHKRAPVMSVRRWIWLSVCFVLFVCVAFVLYIRSVNADYESERTEAIRLAKSEAGMKETLDAVKHVWDESVWVVIGKDADGVKWYVWERADGIVKEKADDGLSREQIVDRFNADHPGQEIVRILPGWFQGQPAWEVRYVSDPSTKREAIDFYSFKDGTKLKTYDLPGK
ncbi:DUF5590 domain-containing protein [Cohnella thermotolerans]|jgi:uncharacterized protein YpmB|uniref:cell wall elongation regulator TseB-like domain-containing protein n=1 Tax=Cohnella thermotolerans TaxID=329858 RepID=UPI00047AC911|nr:DUF5590 domain-containing protein [Cohnella thermotolerans]